MPVDPADPFATPASTQEEHDARMALVAELRAAREVIIELGPLLKSIRAMHGLCPGTDHASNRCGWCRLIAAYDEVTGEGS